MYFIAIIKFYIWIIKILLYVPYFVWGLLSHPSVSSLYYFLIFGRLFGIDLFQILKSSIWTQIILVLQNMEKKRNFILFLFDNFWSRSFPGMDKVVVHWIIPIILKYYRSINGWPSVIKYCCASCYESNYEITESKQIWHHSVHDKAKQYESSAP